VFQASCNDKIGDIPCIILETSKYNILMKHSELNRDEELQHKCSEKKLTVVMYTGFNGLRNWPHVFVKADVHIQDPKQQQAG